MLKTVFIRTALLGVTCSISVPTLALASSPNDNGQSSTARQHATEKKKQSSHETRNELAEVVVTATKREERIQDVPASITALSGEELEKTAPKSLTDLAGYVPGLTVVSNGTPGQAQVSLRGISSQPALGALVGTYVDEVPVGSSSAYNQASLQSLDLVPYDLDRVEVLRGPQGTLYGAGAMGGLLKYVFKNPDLNEFEGRAGVTGEDIQGSGGIGVGVRASVNIPLISDELGVRASGYREKTLGYIDNIGISARDYNPVTQEGGRVASLWRPADKLTVKFTAMFQNIDANGNANVVIDPQTLQPQYGPLKTTSALGTSYTQRWQLYSLVANWDMGYATLTSVSAWEKSHVDVITDLTNTFGPVISGATGINTIDPYDTTVRLNKYTQEVRLTSPSGKRLEWMLGTYYTNEDGENVQVGTAEDPTGAAISGLNPLLNSDAPSNYKEVAAFANGTFKFTDQFAISAGGRYAHNEQVAESTIYGLLLGTLTPPPEFRFTPSQGVFTWMVSPEWHVTKDSMFYARAATGYRPGGISTLAGVPPFKADTLTDYELGFKGMMPGGRVAFDADIYQINWDKMQALIYNAQGTLAYVGNATTARSRGGEVEVAYLMTDHLRVGASAGYADSRLTGDAPSIGGVSGAELGGTPRLNGALTVEYHAPVRANTTFEAGAGYRFASAMWDEPSSNSTATKQQQGRPLDLYVGLGGDRLDTRLYVRNALNSQTHYVYVADPSAFAPGSNGLTLVPLQPRTIGLSVDVMF